MSLNLCVALHIKMTLCQIWAGGRVNKSLCYNIDYENALKIKKKGIFSDQELLQILLIEEGYYLYNVNAFLILL